MRKSHPSKYRLIRHQLPRESVSLRTGDREGIDMTQVTQQQVQELTAELQQFHSTHASVYGPMETCKQETCVEIKEGIDWLRKQAAES
jgi:hypothetical protein